MKNKHVIIKKEFAKEIKKIQKKNHSHHDWVDAQVYSIAERMGLTSKADIDILWDHVVNEMDHMVEYK